MSNGTIKNYFLCHIKCNYITTQLKKKKKTRCLFGLCFKFAFVLVAAPRCSWVGSLCYNFFFIRLSVTIFFFIQILIQNFFFSLFFLLESNVINYVSDFVSVCLVERNISVPVYYAVPFQGVSEFLKKIKNNIYLYFLIQYKIIDPNK